MEVTLFNQEKISNNNILLILPCPKMKVRFKRLQLIKVNLMIYNFIESQFLAMNNLKQRMEMRRWKFKKVRRVGTIESY